MNCDVFRPSVRQFGFRFIASGFLSDRDRVDVTRFTVNLDLSSLFGWQEMRLAPIITISFVYQAMGI